MDYVKTVHILVLHIEVTPRDITAGFDMPVTKPNAKAQGCSTAIGLGDLLYSGRLVEAAGPDLTLITVRRPPTCFRTLMFVIAAEKVPPSKRSDLFSHRLPRSRVA